MGWRSNPRNVRDGGHEETTRPRQCRVCFSPLNRLQSAAKLVPRRGGSVSQQVAPAVSRILSRLEHPPLRCSEREGAVMSQRVKTRTCVYRKLDSAILVMKASKNRS